MEEPNTEVYKNRLVVYADILAFKSAVLDSAECAKRADELAARMHGLKENFKKSFHSGVSFSVLSDSLFISCHCGSPTLIQNVLRQTRVLQTAMLYNGMPLRGGIDVGSVYHSNDIVFGPAVLKAVYIEECVAVYPRIVISEAARGFAGSRHVVRDTDGFYYMDFLPESEDEGLFGVSLQETYENVRTIVVDGLKWDDPRIKQKYWWLRSYFNGKVEKLAGKVDIEPIE